jgi:hypothetical protein
MPITPMRVVMRRVGVMCAGMMRMVPMRSRFGARGKSNACNTDARQHALK